MTSGRHDIVGSNAGDAAALVKTDGNQLAANVWTPGATPPEPGSFAGIKLSNEDLMGYRSGDVDADGRDDLVWLKKTGTKSGRLRVALSEDVDYGSDQTWFEGDMTAPLAGARLLLGDFDANGRKDAAILAKGHRPVRRSCSCSGARPAAVSVALTKWWSGALDMSNVHGAWAGDLTGDGRADLIVRQKLANGGIRMKTAVTKSSAGSMASLRKVYESQTIRGFEDQDGAGGRQPRWARRPVDDRRRQRPDQRGATAGPRPGWPQARQDLDRPQVDPIPVGKTRIGGADIDNDGRTDLVLFIESGAGTRIKVLRTRYTSMGAGPDTKYGSLDWTKVRPY